MKKSVPGFGDEKAPEPPKYAVQEDGTLLKISGAGGGPKKLDRGTVGPIAQRTSEILPIKRYDQPVHHYHEHHARKSQSRDTPGNNTPGRGGPPPFIGNTFHHIPNTPSRSHLPAPKTPTLARAFVSMPKESFDQYNLLHNRTAAGLILGSPLKRYVGEGNVPSLPEGFTIQTSAQVCGCTCMLLLSILRFL